MKTVDYLIIGGSAAGTTAADTIRRLAPDSSIAILSGEDHEQYSRVLLPQYVSHKVTREQIFLKKPEWYVDRKIELVKSKKAASLDPQSHIVRDDEGGEYQYGKVLIAIGGEVVKLAVAGIDEANVIYLRTIEDAQRMIAVASKSKRAVVVGGGLVSLDFAEGFAANGCRDITILAREPYFWANKLDEDSSKIMVDVLGRNGVKVLSGEEVLRFESPNLPNHPNTSVLTKSGKRFPCDAVGVGIGIKPDLGWLSNSGLKMERGILTNEYLETSADGVYAAGDCAEFYDVIFKRSHLVGNWANATSQGLAVGKSMAGERTVYETASSYSDSFFEGSYSFIGVIEENFADEVVSRGSVEEGRRSRIFVKTIDEVMRIVGATIINNPAEVGPLTMAVKNRVDIASYKDRLSETDFDLKELLL